MGRFAIKTPPQHVSWNDTLSVWREADEIELFESAWVFDHLYPIAGDPHGPCLESWVTLTALSQATSRIRVGTMVHGMHFRHPAVTAKMAATLDVISGGRLNLGLGAGWFQAEVDAYGLELGTVKQRLDRFEEGVEVVARLLSEDSVDFAGSYYTLADARCEPKGPQRPWPPITIGGGGERRTLRIVAKWADIWDALRAEPEEWKRKNEVLLAHCAEVGRDASEITRSAHIMTPSDADPNALADEAARRFEAGLDLAVFSLRAPFDPETIVPLAEALREI
ncbi:MAG: LLM class F420-dependent oxidoreductase [Acidimicrobiia bacterium]